MVKKRFFYDRDLQLEGAIYGGQDVVKDGNLITSTFCPAFGPEDQTVELTKALIDAIEE